MKTLPDTGAHRGADEVDMASDLTAPLNEGGHTHSEDASEMALIISKAPRRGVSALRSKRETWQFLPPQKTKWLTERKALITVRRTTQTSIKD